MDSNLESLHRSLSPHLSFSSANPNYKAFLKILLWDKLMTRPLISLAIGKHKSNHVGTTTMISIKIKLKKKKKTEKNKGWH